MRFVLSFMMMFVLAVSAQAVTIQTLETKQGVPVWLVESHTLPMVSAQVAFRAGSAFEAKEQAGLAALTASLLNEGADDMDAQAFQTKVEELGSSVRAGASKLNLTVSLRTLSQNLDDSFELFGLAITDPRFDTEAVERVQASILSGLKQAQQDNSSVAQSKFVELLYGDHPYGHPTSGYMPTVEALDRKDVKSFYKDNFTRSNMVVSIVGDITPEKAIELVEKHLSDLPKGESRNQVLEAPKKPLPLVQRIEMNVPQSKIILGHLGLDRHHPDYFASYAMNYILGGGGFNSRLMEEVREKRGLAYGVTSYFQPMPHQGAFIVSTSTKNKDADTSRAVIIGELKRIREGGVSQKEYEGAMSYLSGSFPLRLDSNGKILSYLTTMQLENLGVDYLDTWISKVQAVSKEDIQRVANELIKPEDLLTVIVGK